MKGKKIGDKPDLLTKEEMNRLIISVAPDLYYYTLYSLLKYTGRRIGEIYGTPRNNILTGGVKVEDIDFENKTMKTQILKTKKRKNEIICPSCNRIISNKSLFCNICGNKLDIIKSTTLDYNKPEEKIIRLKNEVIPLLEAFIKSRKLKSKDYLFREKSLIQLKKVIKKHTINARIEKNFSLHGFRHYFITTCKREGMNNEDIAKWTGHKKPETINVYDRRTSKDVEDKINTIDF